MKKKKTIDSIILSLDSLINEGVCPRCEKVNEEIAAEGRVLFWLESTYPEHFKFAGMTKKERDLLDLIIMRSSNINTSDEYTPTSNGLKYLMDSCILCSNFLEDYIGKDVDIRKMDEKLKV